MIGSPPTVSFVYVTLKSFVSYHVKGSRSVPFAAAGIFDSDVPSRLELSGVPLSFVDELELELELEPEFFLLTTIATGIIITSSNTNIPRQIPSSCVSLKSQL